jgi:hypothetical protein
LANLAPALTRCSQRPPDVSLTKVRLEFAPLFKKNERNPE